MEELTLRSAGFISTHRGKARTSLLLTVVAHKEKRTSLTQSHTGRRPSSKEAIEVY